MLRLVGEEQQPDLVTVADRGEGEDAGDFRGELALALCLRAEFPRRAHVDREQDGQLAFLAQLLDERRAGARGHVPVDQPHLIARGVFAHFVEVHAAAP